MSKTVKYIFIWVVIVALIVAGAIWLVRAGNKPGELDEFAQCLEESGAKFYGAFWCTHCQNQKQIFGQSAEHLPYIECSESDKTQTQVCETEKIEGYPTWTFPNGFVVTSDTEPVACSIQPGPANQPAKCGLEPGKIGSTNFKTWKFRDVIALSNTEPSQTGNQWKFDTNAFANGELSLEFLAQQTGCLLPESSK